MEYVGAEFSKIKYREQQSINLDYQTIRNLLVEELLFQTQQLSTVFQVS